MDLEKLKTEANKITMPQDMKKRITAAVQQSYAEDRNKKNYTKARKVPDSNRQN